ncbi:MAG TPA: carboxypeptidase-like regulatory domain-containing protein [Blastocatellia bacterium]|nr:carboxypeptidase-like regulatory domain-containing protein [Blastocatellia bacterium]
MSSFFSLVEAKRVQLKFSLCVCLLLVVSSLTLGQTARTNVQSATGSITGTVKIGDRAAKGISISLIPARNQRQFGPAPAQGQSLQSTLTDENGVYRFSNLAAGTYNVRPMAEAYVSSGDMTVTLAENQAVDQIDFTLTKGGVITGRITDHNGRPVIAERVSVLVVDNAGELSQLSSGDRFGYETDDRGVYRIFGLPAGRYLISAGTSGGRPMIGRRARYAQTWYPSVTDQTQAQQVEIIAGRVIENIDIKLGEPLKTYTVSGRAIDADSGQPVAGVPIGLARGGFAGNQSSVTNEHGEFQITGLNAGNYTISVVSSPPVPGLNTAQSMSNEYYGEPRKFEIANDNVTDVDVKVHYGAAISGVVRIEGPDAQSVSARLSQLMVNATVRSQSTSGQGGRGSASGRNSFSQIGPDGSFRISGLSAGNVNLSLNGFGNAGGVSVSRIERNGAALNGAIDIAAGEQVTGVVIVAGYGNGVIAGTVNVINGTLPGTPLRVVARPLGTNNQGRATMVMPGANFRIEGLLPGTYEVSLSAMNFGGGNRPGRGGNPGNNRSAGQNSNQGNNSTGGTIQAPQIKIPDVRQTVTVTNGGVATVNLTVDLSQQ